MKFFVTQNAHTRLLSLKEKGAFRVRVDPGGCFGFQYHFSFGTPEEGDYVFKQDGVTVLIDEASQPFLENSNLDHVEEMIGSQFVINNPRAESSCGCKSSFSFSL